jgi:hypothetical protein
MVADFERRLEALKARARVRAARDLGEVAEGLRIVVWVQFFLPNVDSAVNSIGMG